MEINEDVADALLKWKDQSALNNIFTSCIIPVGVGWELLFFFMLVKQPNYKVYKITVL